MKKNKIIMALFFLILALIIIVLGILIIKNIILNQGIDEEELPNLYININKNEEKTNSLLLNGSENEIFYYFDIVNFNEEEKKYNEVYVTPFVNIEFLLESKELDLITWNLYEITKNDLEEEILTEITAKGEEEFSKYFKCSNIGPYSQDNLEENSKHYLLKIKMNKNSEIYEEIEENITKKFSITLGYREVK